MSGPAAGVVHQNVDPSPFVDDSLSNPGALVPIAQVGAQAQETPTSRGHEPLRFLIVSTARERDDIRPCFGQSPGNRLSQATASAGHQRYAPIEFEEVQDHSCI